MVDETYIYFNVDFDEPGKVGIVDRVYRYRLDQFDNLGDPMN
ncbi:hypothetical protein AKJ08_2149 [Vulgatibacter incomptus]|uniref:Uncharacterized protein n=1 Tax=Vulgatibacter incomptus TaxID=1391653 RepID=A0A0K1PE43_9BACT|nr:hypothetical protein AKJ08_2149 [Vulgatibacter incomptus]